MCQAFFLIHLIKVGVSLIAFVNASTSLHQIWHRLVRNNFTLAWSLVWHKFKIQKEATFRWFFLQSAIDVDEWRGCTSPLLNVNYTCRQQNVLETQLYRFYHCSFTYRVWQCASNLIYKRSSSNNNPWIAFSMKKCLFENCFGFDLKISRVFDN